MVFYRFTFRCVFFSYLLVYSCLFYCIILYLYCFLFFICLFILLHFLYIFFIFQFLSLFILLPFHLSILFFIYFFIYSLSVSLILLLWWNGKKNYFSHQLSTKLLLPVFTLPSDFFFLFIYFFFSCKFVWSYKYVWFSYEVSLCVGLSIQAKLFSCLCHSNVTIQQRPSYCQILSIYNYFSSVFTYFNIRKTGNFEKIRRITITTTTYSIGKKQN